MISSGGQGARPAWGGGADHWRASLQDMQRPRLLLSEVHPECANFVNRWACVSPSEDGLQEDCPGAGALLTPTASVIPKWGHRAAQVKLRQLEKNNQTRSCWCSMSKGTLVLLSAQEPSLQRSAGAGPASICPTPAPSAPGPRGGGGAVRGGDEGGAIRGLGSAGRKESRQTSRALMRSR